MEFCVSISLQSVHSRVIGFGGPGAGGLGSVDRVWAGGWVLVVDHIWMDHVWWVGFDGSGLVDRVRWIGFDGSGSVDRVQVDRVQVDWMSGGYGFGGSGLVNWWIVFGASGLADRFW